MNAILPPAAFRIRQTSVSEIRALIEAGLMGQKDPFELIDGVLYEMASEGYEHVDVKSLVAEWLYDTADRKKCRIIVDSTLYLDEFNAPEPDLYLFPRHIPLRELQGKDVSLVIEIANSSLRKDMELKAPLYARFGIREYWIIDLEKACVLQYLPSETGMYGDPIVHGEQDSLTCRSIDGVSLRLADLPRNT